MAEEIVIPALVLELAKKAATEKVSHPQPIAWRETDEAVIIVFQDGRKLTFDRKPVKETKSKKEK